MLNRPLLWAIALIMIALAGDRLFGHLLGRLTQQSQLRYSRMYRGEAAADILLIGNSRGLTFYQPYIEEKTGLSTFNLSYNGLPANLARILTEDYFDRYPAPKTVIIDITICDRFNPELILNFLPYSSQSHRIDTLIRATDAHLWWGSQISHLTRYSGEIFQRALFHLQKSDAAWLLDRVIDADLANQAQQHEYPMDIHEPLIQELARMVNVARNQGAEVQLVISPYFPGFAERVHNLDNLKNIVEQKTGLPVHDYRQALKKPDFFGDFMHPNKKGSMEYLEILRKDGILGDKVN